MVYYPGLTNSMWHLETRVHPPRQPCYKSVDAWPLAAGLPNKQVWLSCTSPSWRVKFGTLLNHIHLDVSQFWILAKTFGTHCGTTVKHTQWPLINVNHAGFDDAEKILLDNDCHHKKGRECECMNTWFWWCQKIIKQGCFQDYFNKHSKVKHCFKNNTRLLQQKSIASRLIQDQAFVSKQSVPKRSRLW